MQTLTVFLAKAIGIYCVVIALTMLTRREDTVRTLDEVVDDPAATMLAGVIALLVGVAMIVSHEVWSGGVLAFLVSVIGWAIALKGLILLALPAAKLRSAYDLLRLEQRFSTYMSGTLLLGAVLIWLGFRG